MAGLTSWMIDVVTVLVILLINEVESETCPMYSNNAFAGYKTCASGCCGRYPSYYCCDISSAAVAGIVLGSIVVFCILIFLCAYCMKKKTHTGRVIRPVQPAASNTIVFTGSSGRYPSTANPHHPHHGHHQMPMPPPYKRHDSPPPYALENPGGRNQYGSHPPQQPQPNPGHIAPPQQAYPYGTRPMGAADPSAPPPAYSSTPAAAPPPFSTSAPAPQYGYGQNHGWSSGGAADLSSVGAPSAEGAGSSQSSSAAVASSSSLGSTPAVPNRNGIGIGSSWAAESAAATSNRNTVSTRNFPSRLPPLPND